MPRRPRVDNKERNQKIYEAYQRGYSQHSISKCIGISQAHVNRIVKQENKMDNNSFTKYQKPIQT